VVQAIRRRGKTLFVDQAGRLSEHGWMHDRVINHVRRIHGAQRILEIESPVEVEEVARPAMSIPADDRDVVDAFYKSFRRYELVVKGAIVAANLQHLLTVDIEDAIVVDERAKAHFLRHFV